MWRTCLAAVTVSTCWACSAAAEKGDVEIGVLSCMLEGVPGKAPASVAPTGGQTRDALCIFKPKSGAEEEYTGKVQGLSLSADQKGALIWFIKSGAGAAVQPGMLQQAYAQDPAKLADQKPPLIGQANSDIVMHSMADTSEGSASTTEKPAPTGFVILGVELKLKSASG